jgi:hypothetical protein
MMRTAAAMFLFLTTVDSMAAEPPLPISSGKYELGLRFAEHPTIISTTRFVATIDGYHITVKNEGSTDVYPAGLIEEGTLMWHASSQQWIIGQTDADHHASDIGGCSSGPPVVDLVKLEYWDC